MQELLQILFAFRRGQIPSKQAGLLMIVHSQYTKEHLEPILTLLFHLGPQNRYLRA
jgi:hypothetical protein